MTVRWSATTTTIISNNWAGPRSCSTADPTGCHPPGKTPPAHHNATTGTTAGSRIGSSERSNPRTRWRRMAAERIDVATAREMWRAGDTVIDVRTPDEYARGHIAGALNVPIDTLPKAAANLPDGPVLTACSMGGRAGRAADLPDAAGRVAFVIDGGTKAWQAAGLPVIRGVETR